jgi:hypothetical protein
VATTDRLMRRVVALETLVPRDPCRPCAERPVFTCGGTGEPCPDCGGEPRVFSITIDVAGGRGDDAA